MRPRWSTSLPAAAVLVALAASSAFAQAPARSAPAVGEAAPAFSGTGATRYGVIGDPVRLSDFHGKTVILAFFFRARSSG